MEPNPPSTITKTAPPSAQNPSAVPGQSWRDLLDNRWLMIAMLFLVTAALGLPFLWASRGFTTLGKVLLTIAVLLWTALVLWAFYLIMAWCLPRIWEGLQLLYS